MEQAHIPHIQRVITYIEEHLKDDRQGVLDISALASVAGYSEYHFLRVFRNTVGLTPADYIRKRRISEIVRRIGDERRPVSDIAFEYGFNSKENFTRAFKKEHNILPTEFRTANCSLRLFQPFELCPDELRPEVSMRYLDSFSLVVYPFGGELAPGCWNRYNAEKRSERLSGGAVTEDFGVMLWNPQTENLDYYIGIRTDEAKGDTADTIGLDISGGLYAVFDTPPASQHDFVTVIRRTWEWIYQKWLPQSGYRRGDGFEFESYVESSRKYSERIYVPLEISERKDEDG
ncbi:MAG: AraC family transcriptional regulator [Oscillospiraceae bacterium]|nr:AraC family transcriptional regulator [Oscillospiraceae bacterium]